MLVDAELQDKVAVPGDGGRLTLAVLIAPQVKPGGRGAYDRPTVPENPAEPETVIVVLPEVP